MASLAIAMTVSLMLQKVVLSREASCVAIAGNEWAVVDFCAVNLARMACQSSSIAKTAMIT